MHYWYSTVTRRQEEKQQKAKQISLCKTGKTEKGGEIDSVAIPASLQKIPFPSKYYFFEL